MSAMTLDSELVERWRRGDHRAASVLITRHRAALAAYFRRRIGAADNEDLLQETLARLTRSVHAFEHRSSFRAYLFSIAERTLNDYLRARQRRPFAEPLDEQRLGQAPAAELRLVEFEKIEILRACLESLSPDARRLVYRFYFQRLSTRAIAREYRVPSGTVRRRLFDARACLQRRRRELAEADVAPRLAFEWPSDD